MFERRGLEDWLQGQTSPSLLWSRLSDAQRVSIYCIFGYFIAIFAFWSAFSHTAQSCTHGQERPIWIEETSRPGLATGLMADLPSDTLAIQDPDGAHP